MIIDENHRLAAGPGDDLLVRFEPNPNAPPAELNPKFLMLHATESESLQASVENSLRSRGAAFTHLALSRDGRQAVQMAPFNARARHAKGFDGRSLGIELEYAGPLLEDPDAGLPFNHIARFPPGAAIHAVARNNRGETPARLRAWPVYPQEQIDTLVQIARLLVEKYGVRIIAHEEVDTAKFDPGPAFPLLRFADMVNGKTRGSVVFDQTRQDLELRSGPGMIYPLLPGGNLTAGTPVSISANHDGWGLVQVMADVDGNPWLVGWMKLELVTASPAVPVVKNHKLFATDGRQYPFISAHPNNFDANHRLVEPKYIVLHTTDGIQMESTINAFTSEHHEASAHLLIGRDGRVVQFVDFDTIAYHAGTSYWEEDVSLNRFSIGIELDNGGHFSHADGVWKWFTEIIPDDEVSLAQHWKNSGKLGWHKFTPVQLDVAKQVIRALQAEYGYNILLTHEVINLQNKVDPGPLFPLEDFRRALTGQPGVSVKVYSARQNTDIFTNPEQRPPDLEHPKLSGSLAAGAKVKVLNTPAENPVWTLVNVLATPGPFKRTTGWIKSGAVNTGSTNTKTSKDSPYYKVNPAAQFKLPATQLGKSPLPAGTLLRIDKFEDEWALVAALEIVKGHSFLEGWVKRDAIDLVGEQVLIYPPPLKPGR